MNHLVAEDEGGRFAGDLDLSGLNIPHEQVDEATHIDLDEWHKEVSSYGEFFESRAALAMARHPVLESFDLGSLRYIVWGATPVTAPSSTRIFWTLAFVMYFPPFSSTAAA